jgi:hypothetical protein
MKAEKITGGEICIYMQAWKFEEKNARDYMYGDLKDLWSQKNSCAQRRALG